MFKTFLNESMNESMNTKIETPNLLATAHITKIWHSLYAHAHSNCRSPSLMIIQNNTAYLSPRNHFCILYVLRSLLGISVRWPVLVSGHGLGSRYSEEMPGVPHADPIFGMNLCTWVQLCRAKINVHVLSGLVMSLLASSVIARACFKRENQGNWDVLFSYPG